jgi:hypothetical protein
MSAGRRRRVVATTMLAGVLAAGCGAGGTTPATAPASSQVAAAEMPVMVVHKTESCVCCGAYEEYLEELGVSVDTRLHEDIGAVKERFGVPKDEWSCHTNEIDGYFVEGHVPLEAVEALLAERPEVDGITLAGMPSGSPGMPGEQTEPFVVRTVIDGEVVGELGRF